MAKDAPISYRIPSERKAALQKLADADRRKLVPYIQLALEKRRARSREFKALG